MHIPNGSEVPKYTKATQMGKQEFSIMSCNREVYQEKT
jgi:hypothetical protein